ncbi:zinc ribbon domain-containing protein [Caldivirga sp.]|uniref:zinc ribbon domain-containing protein n=1 Tax=Caldivirga sp. TaxID=2080243 RepID=UPI003D09F6FF
MRGIVVRIEYALIGNGLIVREDLNGLIKVVNPKITSTKCPFCHTKMIEVGYRRFKCTKCVFEEDGDTIAIINLSKMGVPCPPNDQ